MIRTDFDYYVKLIHTKPPVVRGGSDISRINRASLKGPYRTLQATGRWSIYADACIVCGSTHKKHWKMGICGTCKFRIREMEGYSRRLGIVATGGKERTIFYMEAGTVEKADQLASMLHCKRVDIEEMAIELMYDFLVGLLPADTTEPSSVNGESIIRLLYRMRVAIILEGTKNLSDSLQTILQDDKNKVFPTSHLPGYQQVGGAILTTMSSQDKL